MGIGAKTILSEIIAGNTGFWLKAYFEMLIPASNLLCPVFLFRHDFLITKI
jgi:hypothetical protein